MRRNHRAYSAFFKLGIVTALTLIQACGGSNDKSESSKNFSSVQEMRDKLLDAGGLCVNWSETKGAIAFAETGRCINLTGSAFDVADNLTVNFTLYRDNEKLIHSLMADLSKSFWADEIITNDAINVWESRIGSFLVGDNWTMSVGSQSLDTLTLFQSSYGGQTFESVEEYLKFFGPKQEQTARIVGALTSFLDEKKIDDKICVIKIVNSLSAEGLDRLGKNDAEEMTKFGKSLAECS